jgi:hypothetical protein
MTNDIHKWLVDHPIWLGLIVNVVVGLPFLLAGIYWKFIITFFRVPPQALGTWVRKARLSTNLNRLAVLRRADKDLRYALQVVMGRLMFPFLWLGFMVFNLSAVVVIVLLPTQPFPGHSHFDFLHPILATRIGQMLWFSIPLFLLFQSSLNVLSFVSEYANFQRAQSMLVLRISALQKRLGLPQETEAPQMAFDQVPQDIEKVQEKIYSGSYRPGTRVRHPKYGEGVVLRSEGMGESEKVTVQFGEHGIKKLIAKFSQLQDF